MLVRIPPAILVVDEDADARTEIVDLLSQAGYQVTSVGSFQEAIKVLSTDPPDLLITEVRLGAFNGLHLVIRNRESRPEMAAIILTSLKDAVLEAEAQRLSATYLVKPADQTALLGIVSEKLRLPPERRQWPRKQVLGPIEVKIADTSATLIDLSYEGIRVELMGGEIPSSFNVRLPTLGLSVKAEAVWTHRHLAPSGALRCGARVSNDDTTAGRDWREFVDALPLLENPQSQ
jgi:CheY-like chemotaxis protein